MANYHVDLAHNDETTLMTVFYIVAENGAKAEDLALKMMASPNEWHVTGIDKAT